MPNLSALLSAFFVLSHAATSQSTDSLNNFINEEKEKIVQTISTNLSSENLSYINIDEKTLETVILEEVTTPSPEPSPASTPTPTQTQIRIATPSSEPTGIESYLLEELNNLRSQWGLPLVTSNPDTCEFAKTRAVEISTNFNHEGFNNRVSAGTLPYTSYSKITENIAMNNDYTKVIPNWLSSEGHKENMQEDTPFVCIAKYGKYYAFEGYKP